MMGASLPNPQASTPAGFAAFLSTIGQTPTGGGDDGGFEQLLAAIPTVDVAAPKAAAVTPGAVVTPTAVVTSAPAVPATGDVVAADVAIEAPVANTKAAAPKTDPDTVAASAAKLLIELNGSAAKPETKSLKAVEPEVKADGTPAAENGTGTAKPAETVAAPEAPAVAATPAPAAALPIAASPVAAAVVAAVVGKPVKAGDTTKPTSDAAPTAEVAAPASTADKPRSAEAKPAPAEIETAVAAPAAAKPRATSMLSPVFTGTEAVVAKPADAAPSMTIQFAQPMTTGAAMLTSTAAPVNFAERVLDLTSDGAWIDQLAHDIAATKSDSGDISFRLMPRHLGRLDVAMVMGDEGVALKLDTQHEATATIVTAAQGRLVEDLRQQGVRVSASEVTCTPGDTGRQMQGQAQGQGRGAVQDVSHLIETVTERVKARDREEAADRRGRFA
ncbi:MULTISPECIES: flagellar hook-length control protein FliK [unclassified Sphingopyxis]|jgi:flagellar hook-length control protein FliK|uniref:flagellar hook-length control protein FliK n=1 Tax=unclassified Sphingopyxis TaxID=2614943 RepID=UPI0025DF9F78|nr:MULTISPECIES: flagellar hook-length control protein FliK [unclassified Sphingopyxis]